MVVEKFIEHPTQELLPGALVHSWLEVERELMALQLATSKTQTAITEALIRLQAGQGTEGLLGQVVHAVKGMAVQLRELTAANENYTLERNEHLEKLKRQDVKCDVLRPSVVAG